MLRTSANLDAAEGSYVGLTAVEYRPNGGTLVDL